MSPRQGRAASRTASVSSMSMLNWRFFFFFFRASQNVAFGTIAVSTISESEREMQQCCVRWHCFVFVARLLRQYRNKQTKTLSASIFRSKLTQALRCRSAGEFGSGGAPLILLLILPLMLLLLLPPMDAAVAGDDAVDARVAASRAWRIACTACGATSQSRSIGSVEFS